MSQTLKEALEFSVPVKLNRKQWLAMLEVLEFAYLTYAGVAEQTNADGDIKSAEHAMAMCKVAGTLLEVIQDSAINAHYTSNANH